MSRITPILAVAVVAAVLGCSDGRPKDLVFTGIIDVNTVRVSSQSAGLLTALHFDEGQRLDSAALLATVETEKLGYQKSQQTAVIEEISDSYQALELKMRAAEIQRDNLKTRYGRLSNLLQSGAVTRQAVDDVKAQLDAAEEELRAARVNLGAVAQKRKQAEAGVKVTTKSIDEASIVSPLPGTVLVRYVETGEFVIPGTPICEVADLRTVWTKIYIEEEDLPNLSVGMYLSVHVDGAEKREFNGKVTWIGSEAEFTPKSILTQETRATLVYPAKVTIDNPDGILKIGMPVTVKLIWSR